MRLTGPRVERIGIDLDNTLIDYQSAYRALAPVFGIDANGASRVTIRRQLRRSEYDDEDWQRFQSLLYTDGLRLATPSAGALNLLEHCRANGVTVYLISHKTEFGPARFGSRDLRRPALAWLAHHSIAPDLVPLERISFHDSVSSKVRRITSLNLDVFLDDLEEVLKHPEWPLNTMGLLYVKGDAPSDDRPGAANFAQLERMVASD